ncbi:MAG: TIGR02221 family CRISPR-associated protein [Rhodocyclaceae bacterium]|nr:TIGR02221 family CRISPR-associated protein [Rhodocyclaceae bacterium]
MTRYFVSFLGTSDYVSCNYCAAGGARQDDVRFVQTAVLKLHCSDFQPGDRVLIGCTEAAFNKSFDGLQRELARNDWSADIPAEAILLPEATSEAELWQIFDTLSSELTAPDAEIVFDITHSYRSLPLLFVVLIQYLKVVRKARLRGVHYGAFERLGVAAAVKNMPIDERDAPLIDLTPFLSLFDWSLGIDRLVRSGDASELKRLVDIANLPLLRESKGLDTAAQALKLVANQMDQLATAISMVRGNKIAGINVKSHIYDKLDEVDEKSVPRPLLPVLARLKSELNGWQDKNLLNGLRAVTWCARHGLVQQGYTLLQETLVGLLEERWRPELEHLPELGTGRARRDFVSALLAVTAERKPGNRWTGSIRKNRALVRTLRLGLSNSVFEAYSTLTGCRNDMNHGGVADNAQSARNLSDKLEQVAADICAEFLPEQASAPGIGK